MILAGRVINPGELRTPVQLLDTGISASAGGAQRPERTVLASLYVRWRNVHGNEAWSSGAGKSLRAATVLMRYRAGMAESMALRKEGLDYEIVSIDDLEERHEWLELEVKRPEGSL